MTIETHNTVDVWGNYSHKGKYTFPSFEISKILDIKIPKIVVKEIPDNMNLENSYVFKVLLEHFNKAYSINLTSEELLYSRSSFHAFMNFIDRCILKRDLIIEEQCEDAYLLAVEKLTNKYMQNLRSLEKYYDEIIRTVYRPQWLSKMNEEVRDEMYLFEQAYSLMKVWFKKEKRDSWERYFEHLKGVMEIILREFEDPNLNKILIALLHDVQEDIPEYADTIRNFYGDYIADGVNELSKKDRKLYLDTEEKEICWPFIDEEEKLLDEVRATLIKKQSEKAFTAPQKISKSVLIKSMSEAQLTQYKIIEKKIKPFAEKAKERRNEDYFGHLDQLNDDYLEVKLADRLHNLRDMSGVTKEKAIRKIAETEKYFLAVTEKRKPEIHKLLMIEIDRLKKEFGIAE